MLKSRIRKSVLFTLYFLSVVLCYNLNAQIVTNGSFENTAPGDYIDTEIEGWLIQTAAGSATYSIVDDTVHDGSHALKIVVGEIGSNPWDLQIVADSLPVTPGERYQCTIWAKCENAGAQTTFSVGNYDFQEYGVIRPANITTEWKKFTFEFTIGDGRTVVRGPIHFSYAGNIGNTIYLDNFVVINVKDLPNPNKPLVLEIEDGIVGSGFNILNDGDITYATIQTHTGDSYNPSDSSRLVTFEVTFGESGEYDLFARVRVGSNNYNDDSFFASREFGEPDYLVDSLWFMVNGLAAAGFSGENDVVSDAGGLGSGVWKWINVSKNFTVTGGYSYTVDADNLTQTFQIAAREDGLDIDKIAFGKSNLYYTVGNLDNVEPGTVNLPQPEWEGPPLASNQPKWVGNVHSSPQIQNFAAYWNQVTPENAGKWGSVEGTRDVMNWGGLDAAYALAKDNGFPFHFHVLIWGAQQPGWISTLQPAEQLEEIREWFEAVAARYPEIDYLEVVNEPLVGHNPPDGTDGRANYKAALGGNGATGWDWVLNAFRMAREIFPAETKLMLNDFNIISSSASTATYLSIIRLLQAENLIDIVAEQGHAFTTTSATATMKRNLDSLGVTGLPIQITEFDIDGTDDQTQLNSYKRIFPLFYEHPSVEGITLWGWRRGLWRDPQGAYLINQDGSERAALIWLREYLDTVNVSPVANEDIVDVPTEYYLSNNYPNPFNPTTQIMYSIPNSGFISLKVYNTLGEEIATLFEGVQNAGSHLVTFDAEGLVSGMYIYQLKANNFVETKKLMLLK